MSTPALPSPPAPETPPVVPFDEPVLESGWERAVRMAPTYALSALLHLVIAAVVLIPLVLTRRPVDAEPFIVRVIVADMSKGEDAPLQERDGDGPKEEPEPIPEAPPPGPQEAMEDPPKAPEPSPAPPADPTEVEQPDPDTTASELSKALAKLRPRPAVAGAAPRAAKPSAPGGVPLGTPGKLGGLRSAAGRRSAVLRAGGSGDSEGAVEAGLRWLARHQHTDGRWSGRNFGVHCEASGRCSGKGYSTYDVGLTGLALAAFAGAGYGHLDPKSDHRRTVAKGVKFLREHQDAQGFFFRRVELRDMYNHSCATLALAELYGLTADPQLRDPLTRAVQALLVAQQPGGGWTYTAKASNGPRNDVSIAGFAVQALVSARSAGIPVPQSSLARTLTFLRRQTSPETGLIRYADGGANDMREGHGILGAGTLARLLLGDDPEEKGLKRCIFNLSVARPALEKGQRARSLNAGHYVIYYGTLAAFVAGEPAWSKWNPKAPALLVQEQRTLGCARGSWNTAGKWAAGGGRIYATCLSILTLEVYYKYPPRYVEGRLAAGSVQTAPEPAPRRADEPEDEAARRSRKLRELLGRPR
ncbi:MAG: prenyltransferase/squalene oxidase repeat-containing protein [Planctomycetota bacterium]|jgi:hypothetical protein